MKNASAPVLTAIAAALMLGLASCTMLPTPTPVKVPGTRLTALLIGKAVLVDGCFRVVMPSPPYESLLLVWPPEYEVTVEGGSVRIVDYLGQVSVLRAGQTLRLGGGMTGESNMRRQLRPGMPPDCPGPYWVVGDIGATAVPAATITAIATLYQPRATAFPAATLTAVATIFPPR
ncbi:MAG: hypothetical protein ACYC5O_17810 [Anaerolineae bacterium]